MKIEEAISYYESKNVVLTEEEAMANTIALNVMRKYQQIQKIYSDVLENKDGTHFLEDVSEVLEDGND